MAKNANVSDGTLPIRIGKKKTMVERTASKVIKRPKVIGNIKEIKGAVPDHIAREPRGEHLPWSSLL